MSRRTLIAAGKLVLAAVLVAAVGWQFAKLLRSPELSATAVHVRPGWLVAAGVLYLGTHGLWGSFFVVLTRRIGGPLPWAAGVRAYFVSQFGKYVPGKAMAIVLRVLLLRPWGLPPVAVGVAATYETLTSMAAGSLIAVALLPAMAVGDLRAQVVGGLVVLAGLPAGAFALHKLAGYLVAKRGGPRLPVPPPLLLLRGIAQDAVGWLLLGLSLGCVLRGLGYDADPADFPARLFAVATSYVAGFLAVVSPGGLGAREWVLQRVLAPRTGAAEAALVAVAVRLVWTAAEVVVGVPLYWLGPAKPAIPSPSPPGAGSGTDESAAA